jgi:hypothetical protein
VWFTTDSNSAASSEVDRAREEFKIAQRLSKTASAALAREQILRKESQDVTERPRDCAEISSSELAPQALPQEQKKEAIPRGTKTKLKTAKHCDRQICPDRHTLLETRMWCGSSQRENKDLRCG